MSDEFDRQFKDLQKTAELLTGKLVIWLGKEATKGAIYAVVANFLSQKLPQLQRANASEQEIVQALLRELEASRAAPLAPQVTQQLSQDEALRRIIHEELQRIQQPVYHPPPATPTQYQPPPVTPPRADFETESYRKQLEDLERDIEHYKELIRKLESSWVEGKITEEEFRRKNAEISEKLQQLEQKKQRILIAIR